jgi:hypothetical protein
MCIHDVFEDDLKVSCLQGKEVLDPNKVEWLLNNLDDIQVFNGLAQFYQCFVNFFAFIMALITKLMQKLEEFIWTR